LPETETLNRHQLRDRDQFELAPDCQLLTDNRGVILEATPAASTLLRWPKEFLIGKALGLFISAGYRQRFYAQLSRISRTSVAGDEIEVRVDRRDELRDMSMQAVSAPGSVDGPPILRWLVRDVTQARRTEHARYDLLRRVVTAQEDERQRISRELHDSIGQLLSALAMGIEAVRDAGPLTSLASERLDGVRWVADELGRTSHDLAVRLRPTALDDLGLHAALSQYLQTWSAGSGIEVEFMPVGVEAGRFP